MMIPNVKDYETAFNFLLEWLKETRDMTRATPPPSDDEVQFAMADGYLTCCKAAIVLAEKLQRDLEKDGGKDD